MHYFILVLFTPKEIEDCKGSATALSSLLAERMAPFDENLDAEPYKEYLGPDSIRRGVENYGSEEALIANMVDWDGYPGGRDAQGIYYLSTRNPLSKWDYFGPGGRYTGRVRGIRITQDSQIDYHALEQNAVWVKDLPQDFTCYGILSPDEGWIEERDMPSHQEADKVFDDRAGWPENEDAWRALLKQSEEVEWPERRSNILKAYQECFCIGVDIHI